MSQNSKELIAKNVKKLREEKKLTREALSLILGFENSYISKLEKQNMNITIDKLDKIADFFEKMAKDFHRHNDGKVLMDEFKEMDRYMKKQPLPTERQEFEDRARLFVLMRYIEEFIEIKMEFSAIT